VVIYGIKAFNCNAVQAGYFLFIGGESKCISFRAQTALDRTRFARSSQRATSMRLE
jgi:hypothetical protein